MGISTDGKICFGLHFGEDAEFPWDEKYDGDIEEWWIYEVCKHEDPVTYEEDSSAYFLAKRKCLESKPMPVQLVVHCSDSCPMHIIAVKDSEIWNSRGYPEIFDPNDLKVTVGQVEALLKFCKDHEIEYEGKPSWLLCSYWG